MPHLQDDDGRDNGEKDIGEVLDVGLPELEKTNFRVLSMCEKGATTRFIIPSERRLELIFFRIIFSRLRNQYAQNNVEDEKLPFEAFQRAFERLFYVLGDSEDFDARKYDSNMDGSVSWVEFFRVYKQRNIGAHLSLCERIYFTLDSPDSSHLAQLVSIAVLTTILVSSCCFIISTLDVCQVWPEDGGKPYPLEVFTHIEVACLLIFVLEYLGRLCTVWDVRPEVLDQKKLQQLVLGFDPIDLPSPITKLIRFIVSPANLVDLAAIAPGVVGWMLQANGGGGGGGGLVVLRLIRLTRVFRAFKNPALNEPVVVIGLTLNKSTKALYVLLFQLLLGIVISGSLMWLVERGKWDSESRIYLRKVGLSWNQETGAWEDILENSPFQSIPHAFWWAIVTAVTVGYGDHYPTTAWGYTVAVLNMVFSLVILALPVGVIGGTFSQVWADVLLQKAVEKKELRQEMENITNAIQRLDPSRMYELLFIQVWNDNPREPENAHHEDRLWKLPNAARFMGEALVALQLPMWTDGTTFSKEETLTLVDNGDLVKRHVKGQITIRYEWKASGPNIEDGCPKSVGSRGRTNSNSSNTEFWLEGTLRLTIVSGSGLINLDSCKRGGVSSPYCVCYLYDHAPGPGDLVVPTVWRTATIWSSLSPEWHVNRTFSYHWAEPEARWHCPKAEQPRRPSPRFSLRTGTSNGLSARTCHADQLIKQQCAEEAKRSSTDPGAGERACGSDVRDPLGEALCELENICSTVHTLRTEIKRLNSNVNLIDWSAFSASGSARNPGYQQPRGIAGNDKTGGLRGGDGEDGASEEMPASLPNCVPGS